MSEPMNPSSPLSSLLTLTGVSVAYKDNEVVHNVSFDVAEGHISCLLGPSGCGKSTLLRAIAGLHWICTGQITMAEPDDVLTTLSSPENMLSPEKRQIGMVFQDIALFPHLTIAENIAFGISRWPANQQRLRR